MGIRKHVNDDVLYDYTSNNKIYVLFVLEKLYLPCKIFICKNAKRTRNRTIAIRMYTVCRRLENVPVYGSAIGIFLPEIDKIFIYDKLRSFIFITT